MFRDLPMKKTSLKAKKRNSLCSSKQMKLDSFFVKKNSPDKENLGNDHRTNTSETSFLCLSDAHIDESESLVGSSIVAPKKAANKDEKVLETNSEINNSVNSRNNKRKSSVSLDSKELSEDESLVDSSLREFDKLIYPECKKINLSSSEESDDTTCLHLEEDSKESNQECDNKLTVKPMRSTNLVTKSEKFSIKKSYTALKFPPTLDPKPAKGFKKQDSKEINVPQFNNQSAVGSQKNAECKKNSMEKKKSAFKSHEMTPKSVMNENSSNFNSARIEDSKKLPLDEKNKSFVLPETVKNILKPPKETGLLRLGIHTPNSLQKSDFNVCNIRFEAVNGDNESLFENSSAEPALKSSEKSCNSESVIDNSPKPQAISSKLKVVHKSITASHHKTIKNTSGNSASKPIPSNFNSIEKNLLSLPQFNSQSVIESTTKLVREKCTVEKKNSSSPELNPSSVINEIPSSCDSILNEDHKNSPLHKKNQVFALSPSVQDIFKSPIETEQTRLDICTPKTFQKSDLNISNVLFESINCNDKSLFEYSSAELLLKSKEESCNAESTIENSLKSRAIFSKLKAYHKSTTARRSETPDESRGNSVFKPEGSKCNFVKGNCLNSSVPLFEDTTIKSSTVLIKDDHIAVKAELSKTRPLFEDSQTELNFSKNLTKQPDNGNIPCNLASNKHKKMLFEISKVDSSKPMFKDSFPSVIPSTVNGDNTGCQTTLGLSCHIIKSEKKLSLSRKQSLSVDNLKRLLDSPEGKLGKMEMDAKPFVSNPEIATLDSVLNESGESIIESSQLEQTAHHGSDGMSQQNLSPQNHFDDSLFFEDWDISTQNMHKLFALDTMKRCRITEIKIWNNEKSITVQSCEDENTQAICKLREAWFHTILETGAIVNIIAEFKQNEWVIDNSRGLLILSPDTLISGTSLMGSMFCRRRAILSSSFPVLETGAKCMIIGSLVHLLLQKAMRDNIRCEKKIHQLIQDMVSDSNLVHQLLLSQMEFTDLQKELNNFAPKILEFMEMYVAPISGNSLQNGWNGTITSIKDIEENIWSPTFGMKGKVDVTVEVNVKGKIKTMPFELKTGKSSNSAEHRGQVILYVMMMAQLGYNTDSGLLFYLKDGEMKEVPVDHRVKRDIMMLRNDFVHFLTASQAVTFREDGSIGGPKLPEPIHHHSACAKCPYQTFCCAALVDDNMNGVHPKNLLTSLSASALSHLKSLHIRYVFHWTGLMKIEAAENKLRSNSSVKDIWCSSAEKREQIGVCAANLSLIQVDHINDTFSHMFKFQNPSVFNNFTAGDYVIISSDTRPAVVSGRILSIAEHSITVDLEKDLRMRNEKLFHMDRYESQTLLNFNLSSLSALLDDSTRADELRQQVVELKLPSFSNNFPKLPDKIAGRLNNGQKRAVLRAFAANSYMLIEGMPGCGKTETLAALVKLLVENGKSVLVTSHTHSAVDNLALRLCDLDLLRLGSKNKVHPSLHKFSDEELLSQSEFKTLEDVRQVYASKSVVAVTVLGCSHPVLSLRRFDFCIVDEATQVLQPSVLRPLLSADKFILVGDPLQLPPLVYSSIARGLGLSESLFVRLSRPAVTVVLNTQYRMNKQITSLANQFMYKGALKCANEAVADNALCLSNAIEAPSSWLKLVLSEKIEHSVVFVDVREPSPEGETCSNPAEAKALMVAIEALKNGGVKDESIGVISAYRAQVNLLRQLTEDKGLNIEVNTVDQYQGRDKDVILFSCSARANTTDKGILTSNQRLSVAITRAKQKLIFFGNSTVVKTYRTFDQILQYIGDDCLKRA